MSSDSKSGSGAGNKTYNTDAKSSVRKRKYLERTRRANLVKHHKRGGPGILMTCETGKEFKCQREGLEIIQHYFDRQNSKTTSNTEEEDASKKKGDSLSLEEELKQLKEQRETDNNDVLSFGIFETGCRGTVFVLHTDPDSDNKTSNENDESDKKRARTDDNAPNDKTTTTTTTDSQSIPVPTWDPVPLVQQVLSDLKSDSAQAKQAPGSRFVWRMIPIQATCYTSQKELQQTSRMLLEHNKAMWEKQPPKTFGIALKRRLCGDKTLSKPVIIDTVAEQVLELYPDCKVHLDRPDLTVVVEVCKTLCGLSIIPNRHDDFGNFNLVVAREREEE
eukprot:Nitzschia sp. Nitz4//scaffold161_size51353//9361//10359//NITZ4_006941-RA/size51353-processed-gene-0.56-mRNA-1//1//CDS//3329537888//6297//frame0